MSYFKNEDKTEKPLPEDLIELSYWKGKFFWS